MDGTRRDNEPGVSHGEDAERLGAKVGARHRDHSTPHEQPGRGRGGLDVGELHHARGDRQGDPEVPEREVGGRAVGDEREAHHGRSCAGTGQHRAGPALALDADAGGNQTLQGWGEGGPGLSVGRVVRAVEQPDCVPGLGDTERLGERPEGIARRPTVERVVAARSSRHRGDHQSAGRDRVALGGREDEVLRSGLRAVGNGDGER